MSKFYRIRYRFPIDNISDEIEKVSLNYWESRHFKCQLIDKKIFGKRGTTLGNLFSYDMTKLICDLQVEFEENSISIELLVDGKFQDITEVNLASFQIEQLLFPYYLKNIPTPSFLSEFLKFRNQSAIKWKFSFMSLGRNLSDDLKVNIKTLANGNEFPKVEVE